MPMRCGWDASVANREYSGRERRATISYGGRPEPHREGSNRTRPINRSRIPADADASDSQLLMHSPAPVRRVASVCVAADLD